MRTGFGVEKLDLAVASASATIAATAAAAPTAATAAVTTAAATATAAARTLLAWASLIHREGATLKIFLVKHLYRLVASSCDPISMKAKPRERPVARSCMILNGNDEPAWEK